MDAGAIALQNKHYRPVPWFDEPDVVNVKDDGAGENGETGGGICVKPTGHDPTTHFGWKQMKIAIYTKQESATPSVIAPVER